MVPSAASRRTPPGAAHAGPRLRTIRARPSGRMQVPADIFMSAGEASGDLAAASLLTEIKQLRPDVRCQAIGSERLRAAGAEIVVDSAEWASIGPVSALAKIPKLYLTMRR